MAALFHLAALRAHKAPAVRSVGMPAQTGFAASYRPPARRSRLISAWIVAPDGRLTCRWRQAFAYDDLGSD